MGKSESKRSDGRSDESKSKKEITIKFEGSEILERRASKFGTGAHVIIPKEHAGKKVKVIVEDEDE